MRNDKKSDKNAKGTVHIYVMCLSDFAIGAVSTLHLELATMRRNVQRWWSGVRWDGAFIGRNIGRSRTSPNIHPLFKAVMPRY